MTFIPVFDSSVDGAAMKAKALEIKESAADGKSSFDILLGRPINLMTKPWRQAGVIEDTRVGNCSLWAMEILYAGGMLPDRSWMNRLSPWPNRVSYRILERFGDRAVVVDIPRIEHAEHTSRSFKGRTPQTNPYTAIGLRFPKDRKYRPEPEYALAVPPGIDEVPLIKPSDTWKQELNTAAHVYRRTDGADTFEPV